MQSLKEMVNDTKTIIELLQNERFSNAKQRTRFVDLLTSLFGIDDKDSRKFMKKLGDACTDIGTEMIPSEETEAEEEPMGYDESAIAKKIAEYESRLSESAPSRVRVMAFGPEVEEYKFGA